MAVNKRLEAALNGTGVEPIKKGKGQVLATTAEQADAFEKDNALSQQSDNALMQERTIASAQQSDNALSQNRKNALSHQITPGNSPAPERVNRGYKLREDLIMACKLVALQERRKLYEVMEEALERYLDSKNQGSL
jgi:hypothetical protein